MDELSVRTLRRRGEVHNRMGRRTAATLVIAIMILMDRSAMLKGQDNSNIEAREEEEGFCDASCETNGNKPEHPIIDGEDENGDNNNANGRSKWTGRSQEPTDKNAKSPSNCACQTNRHESR